MRARESIVATAAATTADLRPGRPEASPTADALSNYLVAYLASHLVNLAMKSFILALRPDNRCDIVFDTGEIDRSGLRKHRVRGEPPQVGEPARRFAASAA
ncbi:hypothetical protein V500_01201 [Pseudogymnoascus sp. VKM F-4518 (FW-2643)]|nr:hypothetical protein V500_01201 [Pseudogymnoascus sp. VKM F-4518 (FW-2643)]